MSRRTTSRPNGGAVLIRPWCRGCALAVGAAPGGDVFASAGPVGGIRGGFPRATGQGVCGRLGCVPWISSVASG
ncbi:MAG: hypothetical protein ACRDRL_25100, partial [Sciscionella sp.]